MQLDKAIPDRNQIDTAWVTRVLRESGALTSGGIRDIQVDSSASTNAHIARIKVEYDDDADGDIPPSLILKTVDDTSGFARDSELNYYTRDYIKLANAPIPKCYAAYASPDGNSYQILMEDLASTHEKDSSPNLEYGLAVATALARLHAFGWGKERIHELGGEIPDQSKLDEYFEHVRQGLAPLLEATGKEITDAWRETVVSIFQHHPGALLTRTQDPSGFTIVHGDVNPGNVLYPITEGEVYFLDRQPFTWSLTTWLGVSDLSYLMVQYWDTEIRRSLEMPVLREYHRQLVAHGVSAYQWDQLLADYKLCVVQAIYTAVQWCIKTEDRERMRWLWRLELDRALRAFFDLNCEELWRCCGSSFYSRFLSNLK